MKIGKSKAKIALLVIGILVILAGVSSVVLIFLARKSVNDYRQDASAELNSIINLEPAKTTDVKLQEVWLGRLLSPEYEKVDDLQNEYRELVNDVKNCVSAYNQYNVLLELYEDGQENELTNLNSEFLSNVDNYLIAMRKNYPDETEQISGIEKLREAVVASTDFKSVSADMRSVLNDMSVWLDKLRDNLNTRITEFQKKIN